MAKEYIEREKIWNHLQEQKQFFIKERDGETDLEKLFLLWGADNAITIIEDWLSDIPSADVAPVRHGRWIWADDGYLRCSNCHQKAPVMTQYQDEPMTIATAYCPNYGCRMDLEG